MGKLLSEFKKNVEVDGDVKLMAEVSHVLNELGEEPRNVVFLPGWVRSVEEVIPREPRVDYIVPLVVESGDDREFLRSIQKSHNDSDFKHFDSGEVGAKIGTWLLSFFHFLKIS